MTANLRWFMAATALAALGTLALTIPVHAQDQTTAATQPQTQASAQVQPPTSTSGQNPAPAETPPPSVAPSQIAGGQSLLKDYSKGSSWFRNVIAPYWAHTIPAISLENTPRVHNLIRDGKLQLSMADALALAIENNLDIAVERQTIPMAQTDVLRTESGQAARGFTGATIPLGLSAGALGVGVSTAVAGSGIGSVGGITGGGGAVNIAPVGTFDPTINYQFSWDRTAAPLNTTIVSGLAAVTTYSASYAGSYTQMLPTGTSYFVSVNALRADSTQQGLLYNPDVASRLDVGFNQPLLSGFGFKPNERFLLVARNNEEVSGDIFRTQVTQTIVQVETAYWDMAQFQANVQVAQEALDAAQQLYDNTRQNAALGTAAPLDVLSAQSQVANRRRDLVVDQTNLQQQEVQLKTLLAKQIDPELDAAQIVISDPLPEPKDSDIPTQQAALADALRDRSDLHTAAVNTRNEVISTQYTANNLLPTANVFGQYAGAGLQGACVSTKVAICQDGNGGAASSLDQMAAASFPEFSLGLSLTMPLRNRAAQADNLRAQMETQQAQVSLQSLRNQVDFAVRQALIALAQGKAQVEAAHEAVQLGEETVAAEQKRLAIGTSTIYNTILQESNLVAARYAEVQALAAYATALVAMDQARGGTLERNGISFDDAARGTLSKMPVPPFGAAPNPPTPGDR